MGTEKDFGMWKNVEGAIHHTAAQKEKQKAKGLYL